MSFEYFIANKIFSTKKKNNSYTRPILLIAIFSIALSISIMLLSVMILNGFKIDITNKISGFSGHINITSFSNNNSFESEPIFVSDELYNSILKNKEVSQINVYANKSGLVKTNDEILGVIVKGISSDFDWDFFKKHLLKGKVLSINDSIKNNSVLISHEISNKLQLNVGDKLIIYFIDKQVKVRKMTICGIYDTGLKDFDEMYIVADIKHIKSLNAWQSSHVGGLEISIDNFSKLDVIANKIYNQIDYNYNATSIKEKYPQLFDWLNLQDVNVKVILFIIFIVALVNMITILLILVIDKTRLIGILKALGTQNFSIRKVFLYLTLNLILKGFLIGNLFVFLIAFLQKKYSFISLNPEIYYMSSVPIDFNFTHILLLNFLTFIISILVVYIPSFVITKINTIKAISFE